MSTIPALSGEKVPQAQVFDPKQSDGLLLIWERLPQLNMNYLKGNPPPTATKIRNFLRSPENQKYLDDVYNLYLGNTKISQLPPEIGLFSNLRYLHLGSPNLSVLPSEINNLKQLQTLQLENNLFTVFPTEFCTLTELKKLILLKSKITTLPKELLNLKKLEKLTIQDNPITAIADEILLSTNPVFSQNPVIIEFKKRKLQPAFIPPSSPLLQQHNNPPPVANLPNSNPPINTPSLLDKFLSYIPTTTSDLLRAIATFTLIKVIIITTAAIAAIRLTQRTSAT